MSLIPPIILPPPSNVAQLHHAAHLATVPRVGSTRPQERFVTRGGPCTTRTARQEPAHHGTHLERPLSVRHDHNHDDDGTRGEVEATVYYPDEDDYMESMFDPFGSLEASAESPFDEAAFLEETFVLSRSRVVQVRLSGNGRVRRR